MDDKRAALVERVAEAIRRDDYGLKSGFIGIAIDLIRAEVLEEAADTAERHVGTWDEEQAAARRIAAAIRALKD